MQRQTGYTTTKNPNILCRLLWHAHYIHPHFRDPQCISWSSIMIGYVFLLFFKPSGYLNTTTYNQFQQPAQTGHRHSSGSCSPIPWQWYNTHNQKNICLRKTTLNRLLHTNKMPTNSYLWKHPPTICGSSGHATIITHINQGLCISCMESTCY